MTSTDEVRAAIDELYAQIPVMECRGQCQEACQGIAMTKVERDRIAERGVNIPITLVGTADDQLKKCPALGMFGQCTVYDIRPTVCRVWGAASWMVCGYGCKPATGYINIADSIHILGMIGIVAGEKDVTEEQLALFVEAHRDEVIAHAYEVYMIATSNPHPETIRQQARENYHSLLSFKLNELKAEAHGRG